MCGHQKEQMFSWEASIFTPLLCLKHLNGFKNSYSGLITWLHLFRVLPHRFSGIIVGKNNIGTPKIPNSLGVLSNCLFYNIWLLLLVKLSLWLIFCICSLLLFLSALSLVITLPIGRQLYEKQYS